MGDLVSDFSSDSETEGGDEVQKPRVAGSIHRENVRPFWKDTLQADKYILKMLEEGYRLPFREGCEPQRYKEKNNKSAVKHKGFARSETEK